jgi:hypothetical protein
MAAIRRQEENIYVEIYFNPSNVIGTVPLLMFGK